MLGPFKTDHLQPRPLIGVDEVGRGCLAGPVISAAVIFQSEDDLSEYQDSKTLSEKRREELSEKILSTHLVGLGSASVEEIDEINILQASLLSMKRAIEALNVKTGHVLVDGNQKIKNLDSFVQTTVIQGDSRVAQISAASIVAKVHRDRLMKTLSTQYVGYGFELHKGYSTAKHKAAIAEVGPCIIHRRTFAGVKEHLHRLQAR
jgi:ribonuclease HII